MTAENDDRSSVSTYLSEIRGFRPLSREDERELSRSVRDEGSLTARNALVRANLSFVIKIAKEYRNLGLAFEELFAEGNIGLIEAARRFDATKGTKFITYAHFWIRKKILKALADGSGLIRVPAYQQKRIRRIRSAEEELRNRLGREPEGDEVAQRLDQGRRELQRALALTVRRVRAETDDENELERPIERVADPGLVDPDRALIDAELKRDLARALTKLNERQRCVICARFGIPSGPRRTLRDIGTQLQISRERVRQIEIQAKARLFRLLSC